MKDARERMATGLYALVCSVLVMLYVNPALAEVKLFELIAQGIVMQGFLQLAGAYYFNASKSGVEMAERNQRVIEASATASSDLAASNATHSPASAAEAARQTADAADSKATAIEGKVA